MSETYETTGVDWNGSGKTARPEAVIDAIQSARQSDVKKHYLPATGLPGFGSERPDCGDKLEHACRDCGHVVEFGSTCYKSRCPRCGSSWVLRTASNVSDPEKSGIVARLEATRRIRNADPSVPESVNMKFHHLVFSPPEYWNVAAGDALKRTRKVIEDIMDEMGIQGFIFYHPYRGAGEEENDLDDWKEWLFSGNDWGDVRPELELSPHFHVIGVADYVKGDGLVGDVNEETGWVIKRIADPDTGVSMFDLEAAAAGTTYCLSHTGVDTDGEQNMARFWGHGEAIPNAGDVHDDVERQADHAVREAAPRTLGIRPPKLQCGATVEHVPDDDGPAAADLLSSVDGGDGDGEHGAGDGDDEVGASNSSTEVETCNGALLSMHDIHDLVKAGRLFADENWRNTADNADTLRERYEEWKRAEGYA